MSADFDELRETLRAFAQGLVDHAGSIVRDCGVAGGHAEAGRAAVGRELLDLLAKLRPAISPTSSERIPPAIRRSIDDYVTKGLRPGHCVMAILCDELSEAFHRADPETRDAMPAIVAYVRNETPAACWGCVALVEQWIARPRS